MFPRWNRDLIIIRSLIESILSFTFKFTLTTSSKSCSLIFNKKLSFVIPAELTTIDGGFLYLAIISFRAVLILSADDTSTSRDIWAEKLIRRKSLDFVSVVHSLEVQLSIQFPNDLMVAAEDTPFLSTAIIVAPSLAKILHAALPMPLPAPN